MLLPKQQSVDGVKSLPDGYRAVVVGATGGIGDAVTRLLKEDARCAGVTALSRSSAHAIDLEDEDSIEAAAASVAADGPVHLVFDATGILHDGHMQPEKTISAIDPAHLARSFANNATGPMLLLKHFHQLLPRDERGIFATLSARVGSIADNRLGGWYAYRASKAALNMFVRTAAIEIARKRPQAVCLALHPGTVRTRLSEPFSSYADRLTPAHSAAMLLDVIDRADSSMTGSFLAYDGSPVPW